MSTVSRTRDPARDHPTTTVCPPDFDAFWSSVLDSAARIPLRPSMHRSALRSTDDVDVFEIGYDSLDNVRIAGWYCVPRNRQPPFPGLLIVPGYISEPTLAKTWARRGYATVGVAPRGKLRSHRQYNPGYPGLLVDNILDRNTYAYRGFFVDAARAVDFLITRPEVDTARIGVHGSSQGGALTITTAALRREYITCGAAGAPYLCGYLDAARLTHSYPYEELNDYLRMFPEREAAMRETLNYFDGINFAPRIQCPMLVSLGLQDDVCPPETGFATYEALQCPKTLHTYDGCAHDAGSYWEAANVATFLAEHLRP